MKSRTYPIWLGLAIAFTILFVAWAGIRICHYVDFRFHCEAYLERASNASTAELAVEQLDVAIEYIEENNLTEGIVSIIFQNPANDLGFWYRNIVDARNELSRLPENVTQYEESNVLMRVRESLIKAGSNGKEGLIVPDGITIYPNNLLFFWWSIISLLGAIICWVARGVVKSDY